MVKRILLALLFIIVIGAGSYGTYHFYNKNKTTTSTLTQVTSERDNYLAQLNQIGTMTTTYAIASDMLSGAEITEADLVEVYVPQSAIATNGYDTAINAEARTQLVGRKVRCNISSGTILTPDLLMTEEEAISGILHYPTELTFESLPVTLKPGDIIDLRLLLSNGEEYVVLDHKRVEDIYNSTITVHITEEENAIINSLYNDLGVYSTCTKAYLFKYLEPGNKQTLSFYPVVSDMEDFLMYNPNITDITRCVNSNLRAHIDETLLTLSNSVNTGTSSQAMSSVTAALAGQSAMRQQWLQEQEEAEQNGETVDATTEGTEGAVVEETVDLEAIE